MLTADSHFNRVQRLVETMATREALQLTAEPRYLNV